MGHVLGIPIGCYDGEKANPPMTMESMACWLTNLSNSLFNSLRLSDAYMCN